MYTLENQQIFWNGDYYLLNQGIQTGAKHCVPLANILLTFIIRELIGENEQFKEIFVELLKIWKRFIDDWFGMFVGDEEKFNWFYKTLEDKFKAYDLELTSERSRKEIVMLDIVIFIDSNKLHTKENC